METTYFYDKNWGQLLKKSCCGLCVAIVAVLLFIGLCQSFLPGPFTLYPPIPKNAHRSEKPVTLLVWVHPFGVVERMPNCTAMNGISGCTVTDDRNAFSYADAVIFHHRDICSGRGALPPEPRPHAQKWIWMNAESPSHSPNLASFDGVFNLTASYRKDSDIFVPYGYLIPRTKRVVQERGVLELNTPSDSLLLRPNLVAWVVSNWQDSHARMIFYKKLRQHIKVDVFGRTTQPLPADCGNNVVRLLQRYQFYLAMENSIHTDYITEKLWNSILAGAIPVVLGPTRKNYERYLPPQAFIHVDDFPSAEELARYLLMLTQNPSKLKGHLDWRGNYSMRRSSRTDFYCGSCKELKRTIGQTSLGKDLSHWFDS